MKHEGKWLQPEREINRVPDYHDSFLLRQFHRFYDEIVLQKKYIREEESVKKRSDPEDASAETTGDLVHSVFVALLKTLEGQVGEAREYGGEFGIQYFREAQFAMAALADEIFLGMEWSGKEAWKNNLLEYKLFGSYTAGDVFFQKVDRLIKERDPSHSDIAVIYFLAISMGFKGKYRNRQDESDINQYRMQLFTLIFNEHPDLPVETRRLFPQAYAHTLTLPGQKKLPYMKWWSVSLVCIILLFLVVSHWIWTSHTNELITMMENILQNLYLMK